MIKDITEVNFPNYATLSEATVTENAMGLRTITATVKIDGDIVPDFSYDWEVVYDGERYIHPTRKPQGAVENTSLQTSYDLTFQHYAEYQLKRYFFAEMAEIGTNTIIPDKFNASLAVNLDNFITAFNNVLNYYYNGGIVMRAASVLNSTETVFVSINNTKIWDVLTQMYDLFGVTWKMTREGDKYYINVAYQAEELDHIFKYGFNGGLLKVERQVQSSEIVNVLRGRGGKKNIPYRYFKAVDPDNPTFTADLDYIPELANVYFSELRDINFRYYVQGWKDKHYNYNSGTGKIVFTVEDGAADHTKGTRRYNEGLHWAYDKGYTATKFDPVEWVKDDASISEYGEIWGALENNEDIYPSIQGVSISPYGRVDQVVAVEQIESDSVEEAVEEEVQVYNLEDASKELGRAMDNYVHGTVMFEQCKFTVGDAQHLTGGAYIAYDVSFSARMINVPVAPTVTETSIPSKGCYDYSTGETVGIDQLEIGHTYCPIVTYSLEVSHKVADLTATVRNIKWSYKAEQGKKWINTFDIWLKNIWDTTKSANETSEEYAERVWKPILGDKDENEGMVVFSSGWLSVSQDYEFAIVDYAYDTSKVYDGVQSHWRLTLKKCDADLDTLGLYVPSTQRQGNAGDYFFFTGIDMPHLYVVWAEERQNAYKQDELAKVSDIKPTWNVTFDKIRIQELQGEEVKKLISQIKTGGILRLQDDRLLPSYDTFYVKSKSVKYGRNIYPDLEITLSDDIAPSRGTLTTLTGEVSALQAQVGSLSNIEQVMRYFGDKVYLRKDGIADESRSATAFYNLVKSGDFTQGRLGGKGWAAYRDANGKAVFETDKIVARESLDVTTIVAHQTEYVGGSRIESAASIKCSYVEPIDAGGNVILNGSTPSAYRCYFDTKQGSLKNLFKVDDVAYSHTYTEELVSLSYYKRKVLSVGLDYIVLSNTAEFVDGSGIPVIDDTIIHYGNYTDKTRQYVKVADVIGGGYERFIEGLDSVTATGSEYYFAGKEINNSGALQGYRMFVGNREEEYLEWVNGKLNIKGTLSVSSNIGEQTLEEYIKENGGLKEEKIQELIDATAKDLQSQIDGAIETWYLNGEPTLSNAPANDWAEEDYGKHVGDLYYDKQTGYAYRFLFDNDDNAYKWVRITDTDITTALANANKAQATADGKMTVFSTQPTPPYQVGDIWVNATYNDGTNIYNNDILRCKTAKATGASFAISDWTLASKYTDDSALTEFINGTYAQNLSALQTQVDKKAETWYQATDPSVPWNTTELKDAHVGDIWYNSSASAINGVESGQTAIYTKDGSTYKWVVDNTVPQSVFDKIDGKASIYVSKPDSYKERDLWILESEYTLNGKTYPKGTIVVALQDSDTWNADHWEKKDRYTDDSALDAFKTEISYLSTYLKARQETTTIEGGLVLTSLISLGQNNALGQQTVWSGISGWYDTTKQGLSIAAWYGGRMIDRENLGTGQSENDAAKALFRMDGSGYLAGGNISWDSEGNGQIGGSGTEYLLKWDKTGFALNENIHIGGGEGETLEALLLLKSQIDSMFEKVDTGEKDIYGNTIYHIKAKYGLYSVDFISAYGVNGNSGSGGGAISTLSDVQLSGLATKDVLVYNGTHWVNVPQSSIASGVSEISKLKIQLNGTDLDTFNPADKTDKTINVNAVTKITVPTGFVVGSLQSNGSIAITFAEGYSIPTAVKQENWESVYNWYTTAVGSDTDNVINKWEEVVAFLNTYTEADTLANLLGNKADKTTKITAGKGLSGGGTLAANEITLSVNNNDDSIDVSENGIKVNTIDNFTTNSTTKPLSAAKGKTLYENTVSLSNRLTQIENMFEWDGDKIKAKAGLYSVDFISAYGVGSTSSGGGGLDSVAMWAELATSDSTKVIDISHIPTIPTSQISGLATYATQSWVEGKGYLTASDLAAYATQQWIEDKGYVTQGVIDELHSEIESVSTRDAYIELIAEYLTTDTLAADYITANLLEGDFVGDLDGTATNATNDGSGRNIVSTYLTKAEFGNDIAELHSEIDSATTRDSYIELSTEHLSTNTLAADYIVSNTLATDNLTITTLAIGSNTITYDTTNSVLKFSGSGLSVPSLTIGNITITYDDSNKGLKVIGGGLYSTSYISAFGAGSSGSSGGGGSISALSDVQLSGLAKNDVLRYNGTHWVNVPQSRLNTLTFKEGMFTEISYNPSTDNSVVSIPTKTSHLTNDSEFADKSWVRGQAYITNSSLSGYATQEWVRGQAYITNSSLSGYATQEWVQQQGYITSSGSITGYATQEWVQQQGYITSSGSITGNAATATAFASSKSISLTGDVTGSASSTGGWSIATTIGTGKVTNAMLAGSIANGKLANSAITIAGTSVSLGGSISAATIGNALTASAPAAYATNAGSANSLSIYCCLWGNYFNGAQNVEGKLEGVTKIEFGNVESGTGGYLDFHYNNSTSDYTSRIAEYTSGTISIDGDLRATQKIYFGSSNYYIALDTTNGCLYTNAGFYSQSFITAFGLGSSSSGGSVGSDVTEATVAGWGFTKNTGTVTGVKMSSSSSTLSPSSGVITLPFSWDSSSKTLNITI